MDPDDDILARSEALDDQLAVVKASSVLSTRTALRFFVILCGLLVAILAGIVGITLNTNATVKDRQVLEERNAELEDTNAQLEDVNGQATDWIVRLLEQLRAAGEPVPEIIIRPTTTVPDE